MPNENQYLQVAQNCKQTNFEKFYPTSDLLLTKFSFQSERSGRCWVVTLVMAICYLREDSVLLKDSGL
jgi:hypothetical protein